MRSVLVAVLYVVALVGQQNPSQSDQKQDKSKGQTEQPAPTLAPTEVTRSAPISTTTAQAEAQTPQTEAKPLLSHGEWVMGVLTLIYVLISFFSFKAIKRQADIGADSAEAAKNAATAAQDAARAAERNTEALMNIERPWLIVTKVRYEVLPGVPGNRSHVVVEFKNCGRSIAFPVSVGGSFRVFNSAADLPEVPNYPDVDQLGGFGVVMPPDDERPLLRLQLETDEQDFQRVIHGPLVWYAFGFVVYKDIFGRDHETRFCYATSASGAAVFWPRPGPPKYNLHT